MTDRVNAGLRTFSRSSSKDGPEILVNRYELIKKLGAGNFGVVYLANDRKSKVDSTKVLKRIACGSLDPEETFGALGEARLLRQLDHPSIVKFNDSFLDGDYFCIITEYCEGGDLDMKIEEYKKAKKKFDESIVMTWVIEILMALQYMHSRRVLHRDLKSKNIFLKDNHAKIGDFGISRILMSVNDMASTFTGTPYYMSPEVLKHEGYNSKADIWSVGCIMYDLCALEHAFEGNGLMGVMYKIVEGDIPKISSKYSKDCANLYEKMLVRDPETRPSAGEILKMSYVKKFLSVLAQTLSNKSADSTIQCHREATELAELMKTKSTTRELRQEAEELKFKNMTPRERFLMRKQEKAEVERKRIEQAARVNYAENAKRRGTKKNPNESTIKFDDQPYSRYKRSVVDSGIGLDNSSDDTLKMSGEYVDALSQIEAGDDGTMGDTVFENSDTMTGTVIRKEVIPPKQEKSVPISSRNRPTGTKYSNKSQTLQPDNRPIAPMKNRTVYDDSYYYSREAGFSTQSDKIHVVNPDERPITPMKHKNIFNPEDRTLDFKSVPAEPELAELHYTMHNEFEADDNNDDDDDDIVYGDGDEMDFLVDCMEDVLDTSPDDTFGQTGTVIANQDTDVYGKTAKDIKIRNMKDDCIKKLGKNLYEEVAKFYRDPKNLKKQHSKMMDDLRKILGTDKSKLRDCFMVEQVVFLEKN